VEQASSLLADPAGRLVPRRAGWKPAPRPRIEETMHALWLTLALVGPMQADEIRPGTHARSVVWEEQKRPYHFYVPTSYDPAKSWPVVLALHGAGMNGKMMEAFSGLSAAAEKHGFIVVYPNGTGLGNLLLTWNSGAFPGKLNKQQSDDVGMIAKVLDDLAGVVKVDPKRVFATGMSNGAMMAYRLAAELSERIAAVAPVAGTIVVERFEPKRAVPVLHFHGTKDTLVPFAGFKKEFLPISSVAETIKMCVKANGCAEEPEVSVLPARIGEPDIKVTRKVYNQGKDDAEVVLYIVEGAGHAWPGRPIPGGILGVTTYAISANELMWEFFQKHARK
jgi:polyhydroxybutyrate depolymerase